jgi:putative SOS response-associated peptidase YedK
MCGRYSFTLPPEAMRGLFDLDCPLPNMPARYNIAPTQTAPVIFLGTGGKREVAMMRWGLIPHWAKDASFGNKTINARAETVREKPSFRTAFRTRRCLVPADGFYEWIEEADGRQPYRIVPEAGGLIAFAGLWETWQSPDGPIRSYTIIVTNANARLGKLHDRMPVILDPKSFTPWLNGTPDAAAALLRPAPVELLNYFRITKRVNSPRNDDAACLIPAPN